MPLNFRIVLAAPVLLGLCSVPAAAEEKCSKGFVKPARLWLESREGTAVYVLKIGKSVEVLKLAGSVGTGVPGALLEPAKGGEIEVLFVADVGDERTLWLFRDRVFWPCVN